jgi:hypothetical protein
VARLQFEQCERVRGGCVRFVGYNPALSFGYDFRMRHQHLDIPLVDFVISDEFVDDGTGGLLKLFVLLSRFHRVNGSSVPAVPQLDQTSADFAVSPMAFLTRLWTFKITHSTGLLRPRQSCHISPMSASDEALEYEAQWPALFVEWGAAKVKEWRDRLDHERAELTAAQVQKLEYDISCLGHAIERIKAANDA